MAALLVWRVHVPGGFGTGGQARHDQQDKQDGNRFAHMHLLHRNGDILQTERAAQSCPSLLHPLRQRLTIKPQRTPASHGAGVTSQMYNSPLCGSVHSSMTRAASRLRSTLLCNLVSTSALRPILPARSSVA